MKLNLKSVLTGSAATVALVAASSANASGYYIGLFGGISSMEDDFTVATSTTGASTTVFTSNWTGGYAYLSADTRWSTEVFDYYPNKAGTGTYTGATGLLGYYSIQPYLVLGYASRSTVFTSNNGFDDGFVVGASVGWDFGNGWRTELEAAYRSHDLENATPTWAANRAYSTVGITYYNVYANYSFTQQTYVGLSTYVTTSFRNVYSTGKSSVFGSTSTANAGAGGTVDGDLETWSFMFNVWYDFDFGDSPIHPFVGGGIGFANAQLDFNMVGTATGQATKYGVFGTTASVSYRGNGEATDWGFAYQLGAGLGYDLGNGMTLSAQYRYFNTGAMDLSLADQAEVNLESHNFLIGLNVPIGGGM